MHPISTLLQDSTFDLQIPCLQNSYLKGVKPPFDAGFEAVGIVVAIGEKVSKFKIGAAVAALGYGAFSEVFVVKEKVVIPVPMVSPEILPLLVSGLTASIGLEQVGEMKANETVLVTAAAGATGTFAVQLAKLAGNRVIGTCSSKAKAEMLKSLGCDRPVDYTQESLATVLKQEFKTGVDIVYECVGGDMFETCVDALAVKGRLIVIGMVSGYKDGSAWKSKGAGATLNGRLLAKSASVRGFFFNHYAGLMEQHMKKLATLVFQGRLQSVVDRQEEFVGLESVPAAIDYLYKGKNMGKVFVTMPAAKKQPVAKL